MQVTRAMAFCPEAEARDQLDLDLDCLRECTYVEEAAEIGLLIQKTVETYGVAAQTAYTRFRKIVSSPSKADAVTKLLCTKQLTYILCCSWRSTKSSPNFWTLIWSP